MLEIARWGVIALDAPVRGIKDPKAPRMTWVHWVLYDLPPSASKLPEAAGGERHGWQ